jgi:Flp pilus assembly protein TadB
VGTAVAVAATLAVGAALLLWANRERREAATQRTSAEAAAGLTTVPVNDEARVRWLTLAEAMRGKMRGATVPADAFDEALKLREQYRARKL